MDLALQTAVVTAVLGCLLGTAWVVRRGTVIPNRTKGPLATAGRIQLTPQHSLHIVRFANRSLLVATHPSGCTVIESLTEQEVK